MLDFLYVFLIIPIYALHGLFIDVGVSVLTMGFMLVSLFGTHGLWFGCLEVWQTLWWFAALVLVDEHKERARCWVAGWCRRGAKSHVDGHVLSHGRHHVHSLRMVLTRGCTVWLLHLWFLLEVGELFCIHCSTELQGTYHIPAGRERTLVKTRHAGHERC